MAVAAGPPIYRCVMERAHEGSMVRLDCGPCCAHRHFDGARDGRPDELPGHLSAVSYRALGMSRDAPSSRRGPFIGRQSNLPPKLGM